MMIKTLLAGSIVGILCSVITPNFEAMGNLFENPNNLRNVVGISGAIAQPRKPKKEITIELENKLYYTQETDSGTFNVHDNLDFVRDEDLAQRVIFSRLVYSDHISKLGDLKWKPLYTKYFEVGKVMQRAKNHLGFVLFRGYDYIVGSVENAKFGPHAVFLSAIGNLTIDQIIELGKKIVNHPEVASKQLAIKSYDEGLEFWKSEVSIVKDLAKGVPLTYEMAHRFLYNKFMAKFMDASNQLTTDIAKGKYDTDIGSLVSDLTFTILGVSGSLLDRSTVIDKVNGIINQSLEEYEPYKRFVVRSREIIAEYIREKIALDKRAMNLVNIPEGNYVRDSKVVFDLTRTWGRYNIPQRNIYLANINKREVIKLTDDTYVDRHPSISPDGTMVVFASNRVDRQHDLFLMDTATGRVAQLTKTRGIEQNISWAKNGKGVSFRVEREIYFIDLYGRNCNSKLASTGMEGGFQLFSPDSRQMIYSAKDGVWSVNTDGTNMRRIISSTKFPWYKVALQPPNYDAVFSPDWPVKDFHGPSWSQDEKYLFYREGKPYWGPNNKVFVVNPETKQTIDLDTFRFFEAKPITYVGLEELIPEPKDVKVYDTPEKAVEAWFGALKRGDLDTYLELNCEGSVLRDLGKYNREEVSAYLKERVRGMEIDIKSGKTKLKRKQLTKVRNMEYVSPWHINQKVYEVVKMYVPIRDGSKKIYFNVIKLGNNWKISRAR